MLGSRGNGVAQFFHQVGEKGIESGSGKKLPHLNFEKATKHPRRRALKSRRGELQAFWLKS